MEILTIIIGAICLIIFLKILIKLTKERLKSIEAEEVRQNTRANSEHYKKMELMETEILNYKREIELKEEMINLIKKKGEKHGRLHRSNRTCCRDYKTCNSNRTNIIVK